MSIAINDNWERDLYIATAGQTVFTYSFPIYDQTYISVYQRGYNDTPDNATQLLTLGADYTVTGVGSATGGTIVLNVGAALNDIIAIVGSEPISRTSTFDDLNSFTVTMNSQLNQLTIMVKQVESMLQLITPKYAFDELVSDEVRQGKLLLPMLNDNQIWIGRGDYGDSPDDIVTADVSSLVLLGVDYVIGTANPLLPQAQVLGGLGNGILANVDNGTTGTLTPRTLTGTVNQIDVTNGNGSGNPTFSISDNPVLPGTEGYVPPTGTTAERPGAPTSGETRWNSTTGEWEGWDGAVWVNMVNTGGGVVSATYITLSDESADLPNSFSVGSLGTSTTGLLLNTIDGADVSTLTQINLVNSSVLSVDNLGNVSFDTAIPNGVTASTQILGDNSTKVATTAYVDGSIAAASSIYATKELDNLSGVAINTSLISDTDITDNLGSAAIRWSDLFVSEVKTGTTGAQTLTLSAYDTGGASYTPFITLTAGASPTCVLADGVTATTQLPNDNSTKVATTEYVDSKVLSIDFKEPVVAATTAALTVTYDNGVAGVGATLTNAGAQAAFSIDGQTPGVGQRVLIKNQAAPAQNGIYEVTDAGSGATDWILTRTTDYDEAPSEINPGNFVYVQAGTINEGTIWIQTATVTTIGTDAIDFSQFGVGTYANTELSNLGTTAINASLLFDADTTHDVGTGANRIQNLYSEKFISGSTLADEMTLTGYNSTTTALVDFITVTTGNPPTCSLSGDVTSVTQLPTDSSTKLATTEFVSNALTNGYVKEPVWAASVEDLTVTYDNGVAGVGATLTNAGVQAAFQLGSLVIPAGKRVLIKDQTASAQNGIYEVTDAGSVATNWVLTRTTDYDSVTEIRQGDLVYVFTGTPNVSTLWAQSWEVVTIGTDPILFSQTDANRTLSNLDATTAINRDLLPDTDNTHFLGSETQRWKYVFAESLAGGNVLGDDLFIAGYNTLGANYVPFMTVTAGNPPTCVLDGSITSVTQSPNDNSTKLATTEYVDNAVGGGGGGGSLILIASAVASASATVDFDNYIDGTYDTYFVVFSNVTFDVYSQPLSMRVATNSTPTYITSGYLDAKDGRSYSNVAQGSSSTSASSIRITGSVTNGGTTAGTIYIYNAAASTITMVNSSIVTGISLGGGEELHQGGLYPVEAGITSIRFLTIGENLQTGNFYLYGIKSS